MWNLLLCQSFRRMLSPVSTTRVDGPSTRLVETRARQYGPCWWVMETGHPSTRAVNSGHQLGYWKPGFSVTQLDGCDCRCQQLARRCPADAASLATCTPIWRPSTSVLDALRVAADQSHRSRFSPCLMTVCRLLLWIIESRFSFCLQFICTFWSFSNYCSCEMINKFKRDYVI